MRSSLSAGASYACRLSLCCLSITSTKKWRKRSVFNKTEWESTPAGKETRRRRGRARGSSFQWRDDEERELMLIDEGRVGPGPGGSDSADAERRRLVETVGFGSGSGAADGRDARQAVRF